jgi:hypothetical protein
MKFAVLIAIAVLAASGATTEARPGPTPSIRIVSVKPMRVPGDLHDMFDRVYAVRVEIRGWKMVRMLGRGALPSDNRPHSGHWHLYVDGELASMSNDGVAHTYYLTPGRHVVYAELANVDHTPIAYQPAWSQTVTIDVP